MAKRKAKAIRSAPSSEGENVVARPKRGRQVKLGQAAQTVVEEIKRKPGRPSTYSQVIIDEICAQIAEGKSLRSICLQDAMPGQRTVYQWLAKHAEFAQQYARARELQADTLFDEILEIADDGSEDLHEVEGSDGQTVTKVNHEVINRSRLRVDARKWMAGKLAPKKYGDKVDHHIGGLDGGPIVVRWKEPGEVL